MLNTERHISQVAIESWTPKEVAEAVAKSNFEDFQEFCFHLKLLLNERPFAREVKAIDLKELGDNLFERSKEWIQSGRTTDS